MWDDLTRQSQATRALKKARGIEQSITDARLENFAIYFPDPASATDKDIQGFFREMYSEKQRRNQKRKRRNETYKSPNKSHRVSE